MENGTRIPSNCMANFLIPQGHLNVQVWIVQYMHNPGREGAHLRGGCLYNSLVRVLVLPSDSPFSFVVSATLGMDALRPTDYRRNAQFNKSDYLRQSRIFYTGNKATHAH